MILLAPHDLIVMDEYQWKITGNFLGGLNQSSVVGVVEFRTGRVNPDAYTDRLEELFVPVEFVYALINGGLATHYKRQGKTK